jgi:hypothetical protein
MPGAACSSASATAGGDGFVTTSSTMPRMTSATTRRAPAPPRAHLEALRARRAALAERVRPGEGADLGDRLALLVDGMHVSAVHRGPHDPAAAGPALADAQLAARG